MKTVRIDTDLNADWVKYLPRHEGEIEIHEKLSRGLSQTQEKTLAERLLSSVKSLSLAVKQTAGANRYKRDISGAVQSLWNGTITGPQFLSVLKQIIPIAFEQAWLDGASAAGITSVDELTDAERDKLKERIREEKSYVRGFRDYIVEHDKESGTKLRDLLQSRASMWWGRYMQIVDLARGMAMADQKTKWNLGMTDEHCRDCARVDGKVYRNSVWDKYGWQPGSYELACRGFRCDCTREPTDDPVTPGRPPAIMGPE